jgi:competence protein ComEC
MLDVGQGDAIFLEDAAGHQILIDGGPGAGVLSGLNEVMPLNDRYIDLLILSHPHADHLDGLVEIAKRYQVGAVIESGAAYPSATYTEWHKLLSEKEIPVILARRGELIRLAGDAKLEIIAPFENWLGRKPTKHIHESMVVARLEQGGEGVAMLTGDMEMPLEQQLIASGESLQAKILKVGHHGSQTSTSEEFVKAVDPEVALISVAEKNSYGLPYPATLERLEKMGVPMRMTKDEGTIVYRFEASK